MVFQSVLRFDEIGKNRKDAQANPWDWFGNKESEQRRVHP